MPVRLSVVVVLRDRFSTFARCLDALLANTSVPFQLVVVAAGADDATLAELRAVGARHAPYTLVEEDRLLLQGEARNLGMRHADGERCVVLENDTLVHPGWETALLACQHDTGAAVVMPLLHWHRGIHAAGGRFEERRTGARTLFDHHIVYSGIVRKPIDYPENHCLLLDRAQLPDADLFVDVEPFDVDLGLLLRARGLAAWLEPAAEATYVPPPPLEARDLAPYRLRWDPEGWAARNAAFAARWGVTYARPAAKLASYRRQQAKLGLARWFPNAATLAAANVGFDLTNRLSTRLTAWRRAAGR